MGKNIKSLLKTNTNALVLTVYLFAVWTPYIYLRCFSSAVGLLIILIGALITAFLVSKVLVRVCSSISVKLKPGSTKGKVISFLVFTAVSLTVMLLWYFAYYPGAYSVDSINQLIEATSGKYTDWHPAWHTLLIFTLPIKLTGNYANIVLFQMIYFSLTMGYMGMVIYKHSSIKVAALSVAYVILNPYTGWILLYPWKDVAFAIAGCLALTMITEIHFSRGWGEKLWRIALLGIILANATIFRHNGILLSGTLILALLFYLNKKQIVVLLVSFALFFSIIKIPVYRAFDVQKPDRRVVETTGLPLTILGNVVQKEPDKLSQETLDFAYSISEPSNWISFYQCGNFNLLKWNGINYNPIENAGIPGMLDITAECFTKAPKSSLEAYFAITSMVYNMDFVLGEEEPGILGNEFVDNSNYNLELINFLSSYKELISSSFLRYTRITGVALLAMAISIVAKSNFFSKKDWKRILVCISIFTYDIGTMFFLSGLDLRFFYITFTVAPLILLIMLREKTMEQNA